MPLQQNTSQPDNPNQNERHHKGTLMQAPRKPMTPAPWRNAMTERLNAQPTSAPANAAHTPAEAELGARCMTRATIATTTVRTPTSEQ